MNDCLFCRGSGPFSTVEHIIPESLGNDDLLLREEVCDKCQAYFGKEVELFVLEKTPFAFWRTFLGIRTKRGHLPSVDLSQPSRQKGTLPARHDAHDDGVGFTAHDDGSTSVEIDTPEIVQEILAGRRSTFQFVMTPKVLSMLGRFLTKVGLELLCSHDRIEARSADLDEARAYSRRGDGGSLWPIFHATVGSIADLKTIDQDDEGPLERVKCYSYRLFPFRSYLIFEFIVGTDCWLVALNVRYPSTDILEATPDRHLELIWYPDVK